jgi:hypothetical protein
VAEIAARALDAPDDAAPVLDTALVLLADHELTHRVEEFADLELEPGCFRSTAISLHGPL